MVKKPISCGLNSLTVLRKYQTFIIAFAASLLLHLFLIRTFSLPAQHIKDGLSVMEVRLVQHKSLPLAKLSPTSDTFIQSQNAHPPALPKSAEARPAQPVDNPKLTLTLDMEPQDLTTTLSDQEVPASQPYKYIETDFEVYRNNALETTSATRIIFAMNKNESYKINRLVEARDSGELSNENVEQTSEGMITGNGIQPSYFANQHKSGGIEIQHADFAWTDRLVELYSKQGKKTEGVIDGMQDSISYLYQFMFAPPLAKNEITIADGQEIRTYIFDLEGESLTPTQLGELKTYYLKNINAEGVETELWLAKDYRNIPIKIRITQKNGGFMEQTVTRINIVEP